MLYFRQRIWDNYSIRAYQQVNPSVNNKHQRSENSEFNWNYLATRNRRELYAGIHFKLRVSLFQLMLNRHANKNNTAVVWVYFDIRIVPPHTFMEQRQSSRMMVLTIKAKYRYWLDWNVFASWKWVLSATFLKTFNVRWGCNV